MPHRSQTRPIPASREPLLLVAVDRAMHEMRCGRNVCIATADGHAVLLSAVEGVTDESLHALAQIAHATPYLAITARRAHVIGLGDPASAVVTLRMNEAFDADTIVGISDPLSNTGDVVPAGIRTDEASAYDPASAAVGLAKIARLLPAAVLADINDPNAGDMAAWTRRHDIVMVDAGDIFQHEHTTARTLKIVSEARVPLEGAENTKIVAFRPLQGGLEHLAIVVGTPDPSEPCLVRLHSECFTGDLLGSLRCDCGDQLRGAIAEIGRNGSGVLLYLAQEGRGIGLVNKLRAYALQDQGADTIDANLQLGFDADERVYLPAQQMLKALKIDRIRLLTNNPDKVASLETFGIEVTERVQHTFPSNRYNEAYLQTKAKRSGHLF